MNRDIFKLGAVYRYSINGDLYAVVSLHDDFGSHLWLKLTGRDNGSVGKCDAQNCTQSFWDRFELVST